MPREHPTVLVSAVAAIVFGVGPITLSGLEADSVEPTLGNEMRDSVNIFFFDELSEVTNGFNEGSLIGAGGGGAVYLPIRQETEPLCPATRLPVVCRCRVTCPAASHLAHACGSAGSAGTRAQARYRVTSRTPPRALPSALPTARSAPPLPPPPAPARTRCPSLPVAAVAHAPSAVHATLATSP